MTRAFGNVMNMSREFESIAAFIIGWIGHHDGEQVFERHVLPFALRFQSQRDYPTGDQSRLEQTQVISTVVKDLGNMRQ